MRRLARFGGALAALILAGCAGNPTTSGPTGGTAGSSSGATASATSSGPGAIPADSIKVDLGGETNGVAICGGSVWVQVNTGGSDSIAQVDPATGQELGRIDKGTNLACFEDEPWAAVGGEAIQHLDAKTRAVLASVDVEAFYVGTGAGSVWAPSRHDVVRIDPNTAEIVATIRVTQYGDVTEVEGDDRAMWATVKELDKIQRIDPATNEVVAEIAGGAYAHGILVQDDAVWISNAHAPTVTRIDPRDNSTTTIKGPGAGVGLAEGGGYVWASTREELWRIDPATNEAVAVVLIGGWPYGMATLDGVLWVGDGTTYVYGIPIAELVPA